MKSGNLRQGMMFMYSQTGRLISAILIFSAFSAPTMAQRHLTFEDRVRAQEAIERVYYEHRIWPKENPGPKPRFEQIISEAQIVARAENYLKKSAALERFWQRPITADQLQTEMNRMAKQTKDPDTLRELFAVLNNDPYLIAECLARPVLADRLIRNWYANDDRFHAEARMQAEEALGMLSAENFCAQPGAQYHKVTYRLEGESPSGAPVPGMVEAGFISLSQGQFDRRMRETPPEGEISGIKETLEAFVILHTLRKTELEIELESLSFSKRSAEAWLESQAASLDFAEDAGPDSNLSLPSISATSCVEGWNNGILDDFPPSARVGHTAIWTGSEMIIWGGNSNTGGRYNPSTDSWNPTSNGVNVPAGRSGHTAVWTGSEMIVWGGVYHNGCNTGGRYNPSTDTWMPTSTGPGVPSDRYMHTAVWTGTEMIIWGGYCGSSCYLNTGGRYDPTTDSWTPTSIGSNVPAARYNHTTVWTGTEMIIWGGFCGSGCYLNTGGRYNPSGDSWTPTSIGSNAPSARYEHTAVWTGTEMIVWGGYANGYLDSGGRYNPSTDSWNSISTGANVPSAREEHTSVWTGTRMIIWGGYGGGSICLNTGGRYNPSTNSWSTTSTGANVPTGRRNHTVIWTGTEMIVWGGYNHDNNYNQLNTGGRYNPSTDSWVPTSTGPDSPAERYGHSAIWTGSEMIIWGGDGYIGYLASGGRYNPSTDSWTFTSTGSGVPTERSYHTAVWTGSEMIIWGGYTYTTQENCFNTGGRYDPTTDSWTPTSMGSGVPSERAVHTAVWTGTEMIIWGGYFPNSYLATGGRYNPSTDSWMPTSVGTNVPSGRVYHTAVWTGDEMIVWGGSNYGFRINTGGRYNPSTDSWVPTSIGADVPSVRDGHTAVWTGMEMIVWGGYSSSYVNTGGYYNPSTDSWTPTSAGFNVPSARYWHSAIWTGTEMIVWGGEYPCANTGGRYNPTTDSWIPTSMGSHVPPGLSWHTAVWTGTGMIVWGGYDDGLSNIGGRYDPFGSTPEPPPTAGNNGPICAGQTLNLMTPSIPGATYAWLGPNGFTSSQQNPGIPGATMAAGGRYAVTVTVGGCASMPGTTIAVVYPPPVPTISGPTPPCASGLLSTQSFSSYQWYRNGSVITGATAQTYNAVTTGTYTVVVTDANGCAAVAPGFYISPYPATPVITGPEEGCAPLFLSTGVYYSYQWNLNGSPIPGATVKNHPAIQSGVHTVTVDNASGCTAVSAGKAVTVWGAAVIQGGHFNTCPDTTVTLGTLDAYASYQWNYYGNPIPGATEGTYAVTVIGDYSVTTTDSHGCVQTTNPYPVFIDFCPGSEVSPGNGIFPLQISKDAESSTGYYIHFQRLDTLDGYNIYEGTVGFWYSHADAPGNDCAAVVTDLGGGVMRAELNPSAGDHYYLVTAFGGMDEGPSGFDNSGTEIPASQSTCMP